MGVRFEGWSGRGWGAVGAGQLQGWLAERVKVVLNGGELVVSWAGIGQPVLMTGPATTVYQGRMEL